LKVSRKLVLLGIFAVLAAAFATTQFGGVAQAQAPIGTTKSCTTTTAPTAATAGSGTCTVTITSNFNAPATIDLVAPTPAGVTFSVTGTGATGGTPTPATAAVTTPTSITVSCGAVATCGASAATPIVITEAITIAAGTALPAAVAQTFTPTGGTPGALPGATLAAPTAVVATAPTITAVCTPVGGTAPTGATVTAPATATSFSCVLDFNDTTGTTSTVASGTVTITVAGPSGVTVSGSTVPAGNSIAVHCPPGSTVGNEACDTLTVTVTVPGGLTALPAAVMIHVQYAPDAGTTSNLPVGVDLTLFTLVQGVLGFIQPHLIITCTNTNLITVAGPIPGELTGTLVAGVGVLPNPVTCIVDADGPAAADELVAPGTIEISSLNGGLLDASGGLSTNLRIGCGDVGVVFAPGVTINPNTCDGVRFSVVGAAVGFVQIRARYEPASAPAAAGIREAEATVEVAFVAPAINFTLSLAPNPVAVDQRGTATLTFLAPVVCGALTLCVDPNTGLPITFIPGGSLLNGTVVFTIGNAAIASWVGAQTVPATGAPPSSATGIITSANQASVRCGFFPTAALPTSSPLGSFFGGCTSVSATYQGNTPGTTNVTATFIPDLPGAFGSPLTGLSPSVAALVGLFGVNPSTSRTLEVAGPAPSGAVALARGCNNVSPTVTESAAAYAARVTPAAALVAIWEHQAATNTFKGYSPQAGAPNDLAGVTRLRPVFVCVSAAANLDQPPA
jgi:hypothetical protein